MSFPKALKKKVKSRVSLKNRTAFRIGGKAEYWYEPGDRYELANFLKNGGGRLSLFLIGRGTNLLVKEGLIKKVFVSLSKNEFSKIEERKNIIRVGAGLGLNRLVSFLRLRDLGGYEFLAGIPGTIGGALVMNAGARNDYRDERSRREMKDIVSFVEVLDRKGRILRLPKKRIRFFYRSSSLKPYIIISAGLKFYKADRHKVRRTVENNLRCRLKAQDYRFPSAGSYFKNPRGRKTAGELIDVCGLRGKRVGGAQVSDRHANFIINRNDATSADVLKLMEIIHKRVYNRFKIMLEPEVEFVS